MDSEKEIMEKLHELDRELKSFPKGAHWFCPRQGEGDQRDFDNADALLEQGMSIETQQQMIKEAKTRHKVAYNLSLVLGLPSDIAGLLLVDYKNKLDNALNTCEKCIRNWHMGRKTFLKDLREDLDEDTIAELSNRLNQADFRRLDAGLVDAKVVLTNAEPSQRSQKLLAQHGTATLLALFEALCCVDYLKSEHLLSAYFNYVFEQTQARKVLRLSDVLPAMARFLFDKDKYRLRFATTSWKKMTEKLTPDLFEWVVHDALSEAIDAVAQTWAKIDDIQRFWEGFRLISKQLDQDLITHHLRGMETQPGIYHLALQHLSCGSEEVWQSVIESLRQLLWVSPKNFWAAFGTISPTNISELIFLSPAFEKLLAKSPSMQELEKPIATAWISDFIRFLPSVHQFEACRSLLHHLLERLQENRIAEPAKLACRRAGLDALCTTLMTFVNNDYKINPSNSLIVIDDVVGLFDKYRGTIIDCADLKDVSRPDNAELKRLGMAVISNALALDCKALNAEYFALENGTAIQRGSRKHSQPIWQAVLDIFRPGNLDLAKSIIAATSPLTGLDEIRPEDKKKPQFMPKDHVQFNKDLNLLTENVSKIIERLSDFDASDLLPMYQASNTARPLFATLVSANQNTYEAAIGVIKEATAELLKEDAISALLEKAFNQMLSSFTYASTRIVKARSFAPVPYMIKMGRAVLEALCGNRGYLRAHSTLGVKDQGAVMTWWTQQWRALDAVFQNTETWSSRVNQPIHYMQSFCRDCMEYAESLLDQYTIIASALGESTETADGELAISGSSKASLKKVLEVVCSNVNGLTMMLRLKDGYLVSVITSLFVKLLRCLSEYDLEIEAFALDYIKRACLRENNDSYKKTNLTNQQKATLQRALDDHQGLELIEETTTVIKKQATIESLFKSSDGVKKDLSGKSAELSLALKSSDDKSKSMLESMRTQQAKQQAKKADRSRTSSSFNMGTRRKEIEDQKARNAAAAAQAKSCLVRGEGSGLKGINGVVDKDHAPVRSEIMVGSSDEDSDEPDEDESNVLFKKRPDMVKKVQEHDSRRRALKQPLGPVKKMKIQRSTKDLRARVEPNMDRLYVEILNWDIFHRGDEPPSNNECLKIADKFLDLDLYKRTFGPLLISEVWRSLVTAKEEGNFKPVEIKILNRLSVDKFMEVSATMPPRMNRDLQMSERDIVLLSKSHDPLNNPQEPHCLARVDRTSRKKEVVELTYRVSKSVNPTLLQHFAPNGKMFAVKIADMTTTQREFAALSSLEYYDLCSEILEAKPSPIQKYSDEKVSSIVSRYILNKGQAQAILSAVDNDGFTPIQGPPGSGKTKTIVAMVGALLTPVLREQAEQVRARPNGPNGTPASALPKKKLLICAPSNAAVDELVVRLKDGVQPLNGTQQKINVIRIGRSDAINASVKDVMLDELVKAKLDGDKKDKQGQLSDREKLHQEAGKIKEQLNLVRPQMDTARVRNDRALELRFQREFDGLKRRQAHIGAKIDEDKESGNTVSRENEINRRRFQQEIIDGAHVLCATLSGSGHDMFRNLNVEFETVIIDEAAQCIELSAVIPLKYGASKCILVGDPEQLPPTVLSRFAQSYGYEQSLFVRMQKNHPKDVHLLDTQYRMHPEISQFPSAQFYKGRLIDGDGMAKLREKPWHASSIFGPYRFFDVKGIQTKEAKGHSFINVPELNAAMQLYDRLKADYSTCNFKGKIGIITSYKAQFNELKNRFSKRYGDEIYEEIEFNTTDAFQGREREIIIYSCVRAKASGGIGFLGDIRRMNVGLTRAKSSLWVLGDSRSLQQGEFWNKLIEDAKARDRYTGGDFMALLSKPTSRDNQAPSRPSNNNFAVPARQMSRSEAPPSATGSTFNYNDVEMVDAPSISSSRKSSIASASTETLASTTIGMASNLNQTKKRPREESIKEENFPAKKERTITPPPPKPNSLSALAAELDKKEEQGNKPSTAGPPPARPAGVSLPRKKAPADPFIRKKPARR